MQDIASSADHRLHLRQQTEQLLHLAQYLAPSDRELVCSIYHHGMTPTQLARAIGARPRAVRARLQRLLTRINSPTFRYVLATRHKWTPRTRRIAEAIFLRGEAQRQTAARAQTTLHHVRRESQRIRANAEAAPVTHPPNAP